MKIIFTKHAQEKFHILKEQGFIVEPTQVEATITKPDFSDKSKYPIVIVHKPISLNYLLRVIFEQENGTIKIITFYPVRRERYQK